VTSNDPDENPFLVPVTMRAIGRPQLTTSRDTIAYGAQFLGVTRTDSVVVRNSGSDVLSVTSVSAAPGVFTTSTAPFDLAPGDARGIAVRYAPTVVGTSVGALTIASNDPVRPTVLVTLIGTGLEPPVASVDPTSLHFEIPEGGHGQTTLRLSNTGGSDLPFAIGTSTAAVAPSLVLPEALRVSKTLPSPRQDLKSRRVAAVVPAPQAAPDAIGNKVLVIADGGTEADVIPVLTAAGYAVTQVTDDSIYNGTNPPLTGFNLVVLLDGPGVTTGMPAAGQTAIKDFVTAGGGMISTEWLAYEIANLNYTILAPLIPLTWDSAGEGVFTWNVMVAHPVTAGVSPSFNVTTTADIGTANSGTVLVASGSGAPMVIAKQVGSGRVVHFSCGGNFNGYHPFNVPDMQRMLMNAANWMSGATLLSATPSTGVVPAHGSLDLAVTVDAGPLHSGTFNSALLISTNDPVHPLISVPATIDVTPAADVALQPDTLRFAATAMGSSRVDTVQVSNPGSLTLHVSGVSAGAPFGAPAAGFDLAPGGIRKLAVTFSPLAPGPFTGSLVVSSDDPDEPTASVVLKGTGLAAGSREETAQPAPEPPVLSLALHGFVPNPPVRDLVVAFSLPDAEPASIELMDLAGRRLRQVEVGGSGPGRHTVSLGSVGALESGLYLVRLRHGGQSLVSKCVLMK